MPLTSAVVLLFFELYFSFPTVQKSTHSVIGGLMSICQSNALNSPLCSSSSPTRVQSMSRMVILIVHLLPLGSTSCQTMDFARSFVESFCRNFLTKESILLCSSCFISSRVRDLCLEASSFHGVSVLRRCRETTIDRHLVRG